MMKVKVYDNGGATCDRYTVILNAQGDYVAMSSNPFDPQGFGQHGEGCGPGKHLGKRIKFEELPEDCKKLVRRDLLDAVVGVPIINKVLHQLHCEFFFNVGESGFSITPIPS